MSATRRLAAATLVLAAATAPTARSAGPGDSDPADGVRPWTALSAAIPVERAKAALRRAERLRDGRGRGDLTLALMRLVQAYPVLPASQRARAQRLLARPTSPRDPEGNGYRVPEAPASPVCDANFCVHWVGTGKDAPSLRDGNGSSDGDGVPDYVEQVVATAQQTFAVENGRLGWREPKSDGKRGGQEGKTDIYLVQLRGGLFGYAAPDRGQIRTRNRFSRSLYSYLVVDDDYRRSEFPGTTPAKALQVTAAHEYNHILQFTYDVFQDTWFAETSAVWAEEQVYDAINDYRRYVRRWVTRTEVPLTGGAIKIYGSSVWNLWLQRRYGADLIRKAWARAQRIKPGGYSVAVYGSAIRGAGRSDFSEDLTAFSRDAAEWRTGRAFEEGGSYRDVERAGVLVPGARPRKLSLNHTTFQLLDVPTRGRTIRVSAAAPRGVAAGLALVGRTGSERQGETVSRQVFRRGGGRMRLALRRPGRFDRLTAVVVNAEIGQRGFNPRSFDWRYTGDGKIFTVAAR